MARRLLRVQSMLFERRFIRSYVRVHVYIAYEP